MAPTAATSQGSSILLATLDDEMDPLPGNSIAIQAGDGDPVGATIRVTDAAGKEAARIPR